jgi:TPR repeat protein
MFGTGFVRSIPAPYPPHALHISGVSDYHGINMIATRTLLLACLLLPPLAQAQTHAQAEDRPGRVVLVPMSVERPAGEGWAMVRRTDSELVFVRPADGRRNGRVAIANGKVPEKRARSAQDLAANVREDLKKNVSDKRFEVLAEEVRPEPEGERKCVRYHQRARDLGARRPDGTALTIDLHGLACLHPEDEGIVLAASLSERGPQTGDDAGLAEEAARFFAGIRPHSPLKDKDWQAFAEKGDANAQVWLARHLMRSNGIEQAVVWLKRAADQNHPDAQALLGLAHLTGRAVTRNPEEAVKWLRPAAEKGYPKAGGLLALALISAAEVRNEAEAANWARKAAENGDPLGQALLGDFLLFGRAGLEKDEAAGAGWTRRAAERGDARAEFMLAGLLANGIGTAKDPVQSRFWLELAAAQGHAEARKIVAQIKRPPDAAPAAAPAENQ